MQPVSLRLVAPLGIAAARAGAVRAEASLRRVIFSGFLLQRFNGGFFI